MRRRHRAGVWLCVLAVGLPGCQRVNLDETIELGAGAFKSKMIDAPRSDQPVMVSVRASGGQVEVYVVLEKDRPDLEQKLQDGRTVANALAKGSAKDAVLTLTATVPARSAYAVVVSNGSTKPATVTLTVTGK